LPSSQDAVKGGAKPAASEELPGRAQVRKTLREACAVMGRTEDDVGRIVALLEEEWLCDPRTLQGLSDDGWHQLRIPLGLKEELRRRIHSAKRAPAGHAKDGAEAGAASSAAQGAAAAPAATAARGKVDPPEETHEEEVLRLVREEFRNRAMAAQTGSRRADGGLRGLAQRFLIMDDDNNKKVSKPEFKKGINELQLPFVLSAEDFEHLWNALDEDGSGFASFDEIVNLLGQTMTPRRRHAVRSLFKRLDRTGDETIQIADVKQRYRDGGCHEENLPSDDELFAGLENFRKNIGAGTPGVVRLVDFEKYYDRLGRNLFSDAYFEEMLTRAWRLEEGWLKEFGPPPRVAEKKQRAPRTTQPAAGAVEQPRTGMEPSRPNRKASPQSSSRTRLGFG
jgi:Ca2+-binding EF-hand superfamily protein